MHFSGRERVSLATAHPGLLPSQFGQEQQKENFSAVSLAGGTAAERGTR